MLFAEPNIFLLIIACLQTLLNPNSAFECILRAGGGHDVLAPSRSPRNSEKTKKNDFLIVSNESAQEILGLQAPFHGKIAI